MFWKKVNRGLLLGAVLLILLVGVIVVGEVRFKQETPMIKERGEAYLTDLCKLQCDLQGELGKAPSAEEVTTQKDQMSQLLKKHWYGNLPEDEYSGSGVSTVRAAYDEYLDQKIMVLFSSAEVHMLEDRISVKKDGPNRAILDLAAEIKTEYAGKGNNFFYGGNYYGDGYYYYYDGYDQDATIDPTEKSGVFYIYMTLELERVGGEWKIVGYTGGGYETESYAKGES